MAIEHVDITDPEIHEPVGCSTASSGMVYVADGLGSGTWTYLSHSALRYEAIGTGTTYTGPTTYTLINPTTVGDTNPIAFTHNSAGRLTYTGTPTIDVSVIASVTLKHSAGAGVDCYFQIHKNGSAVTGTQNVVTADSATYMSIPIHGHFSVATNDYIEIYCKAASGNIIIHAMHLKVSGDPL